MTGIVLERMRARKWGVLLSLLTASLALTTEMLFWTGISSVIPEPWDFYHVLGLVLLFHAMWDLTWALEGMGNLRGDVVSGKLSLILRLPSPVTYLVISGLEVEALAASLLYLSLGLSVSFFHGYLVPYLLSLPLAVLGAISISLFQGSLSMLMDWKPSLSFLPEFLSSLMGWLGSYPLKMLRGPVLALVLIIPVAHMASLPLSISLGFQSPLLVLFILYSSLFFYYVYRTGLRLLARRLSRGG